MSALLLKASPFSPSVLALAKTNTKQSSLRSQRKQSSSDVVVVSGSAGVGQGTSLPSLPSLAIVRLRFLCCYPFAGKSINLSNVIVILMMMTMISPRLSLSLILSLKGGLEMVTLKSGTSTAVVYLFGGVVTSFTKSGRDVLYVRPDAKFDKSKPISGGVPHCWPQFGPGEIQVHGFARNVDWTLVSSGEDTICLLYTSPSPRDQRGSRMPSSA